MKNLTLSSLRTFCAVAEAASFTAAASRVFRTQPSLSRQVAQLERELGVRLFDRQGRSLALTPAGEDLYRRASRVVGDAADLQTRARAFADGDRRALRVGANPLLYDRTMPDLLSAYGRRRRDVVVSLTAASAPVLQEQIEARKLDVAFTRFVSNDAIAAKRLFPMHLIAVVSEKHRYAGRRKVEVEDLEEEPLLLLPREVGSRTLLDQACRDSGILLRNIRLECGVYNGLISLATAGHGVAVVLSMVDVVDPRARIIPIEHRGQRLGAWAAVIWNRQCALEQAAGAFIDLARRRLAADFPGKRFDLPPLAEPDGIG